MTRTSAATARTALYAGTFDPLTNGHLDVMAQGGALFDRIVVAIGVHHGKAPWLSFDERVAVIRDACAALGASCAFEVTSFDGLVVEAARATWRLRDFARFARQRPISTMKCRWRG